MHPFIREALIRGTPQDTADFLKEEIAERTRQGDFWGQTGALSLENFLVKYAEDHNIFRAGAHAGRRSSTFYAASGNAWRRFRVTYNPWWLWMTIWMTLRAAHFSGYYDRKWVQKTCMSADELDVRAAILARTFRKKSALYCIELGLQQNPSADTYALLLARKASLIKDESAADQLFIEARNMQGISPMTHSRIVRAHAAFFKKIGETEVANKNFHYARLIAEKAGLADQALKAG